MVIVIYGKSSGGVWRALCTLKGCSSALLRVAALKGPETEEACPRPLRVYDP